VPFSTLADALLISVHIVFNNISSQVYILYQATSILLLCSSFQRIFSVLLYWYSLICEFLFHSAATSAINLVKFSSSFIQSDGIPLRSQLIETFIHPRSMKLVANI